MKNIKLNSRDAMWAKDTMSYEDLLEVHGLKNSTAVYTVTYTRGPEENREGTLIKGKTITIPLVDLIDYLMDKARNEKDDVVQEKNQTSVENKSENQNDGDLLNETNNKQVEFVQSPLYTWGWDTKQV